LRGDLAADYARVLHTYARARARVCVCVCARAFGVTDLREKSPQLLELLERSRPLGAASSAVCSGDPSVRSVARAGSLTRSKRAIRITIKLRSRARARRLSR